MGRHWPHWGNLPEYPMGNAATIALTLMIAAFLMASGGPVLGPGLCEAGARVADLARQENRAAHCL
jgi:hypothetical protein